MAVFAACIALPTLLVLAMCLYFTGAYLWYFVSSEPILSIPLLLLSALTVLGILAIAIPPLAWLARTLKRRSSEPPAGPIPVESPAWLRAGATMTDYLWAFAPGLWPALALLVGARNLLAVPGSLRLTDPVHLLPAALGVLIAGSFLVTWVAWGRTILARHKGELSPLSPGRALFCPPATAVDRRLARARLRAGIISAALLLVCSISLAEFVLVALGGALL